jgi:hypothetical protein
MTAVTTETKHPLIEVLRLISAFLIVWYHSELAFGHELAYSGLIVFVFLSAYYSGASKKISIDFHSKVSRFIWPWLFWSLIYGVGYVATGRPFFKYHHDLFSQVLVGNSIHLWYLPFIFLVLVSLDILKNLFGYMLVAIVLYFSALFYFILAESWRPFSLGLPVPFPQYFHALGAVFVGFYWGALNRKTSNHKLNWLDWSALIALMSFAFFSVELAGFGLPYSVGVILAVVFLVIEVDPRFFSNIKEFSDCSFGIYLVHPILLHLFGIGKRGYLTPVVVFAISFFVIYYCRQRFPVVSRYVT